MMRNLKVREKDQRPLARFVIELPANNSAATSSALPQRPWGKTATNMIVCRAPAVKEKLSQAQVQPQEKVNLNKQPWTTARAWPTF
jgi:hypothetical protein